mgnify:CR=1 FL=1
MLITGARQLIDSLTSRRFGAARGLLLAGCLTASSTGWSQGPAASEVGLGMQTSSATTLGGESLAWREHLIDDPLIAGFALSGSDGLVVGDIDGDGLEDIVSVHESDSEYDSSAYDPDYVPDAAGHVRIAFRSAEGLAWDSITLAEGADTPAPEDVAIADLNGDGLLDVIVAAELSHLIYLQNPGPERVRQGSAWPRLILPMTQGNGSYIRVFLADRNDDGKPEALAANKGAQRPGPEDYARATPVSLFSFVGDPLAPESWDEVELGRFSVPQNAEPVDLDDDGDLDVLVGSRGENRLVWFENQSDGTHFRFVEHAIGIVGASASGFNFAYADMNQDGRLDIVTAVGLATLPSTLAWLEQPLRRDLPWISHPIGTLTPDSITGIAAVDIDGDGDSDVFVGSYSSGSREEDAALSDIDLNAAMGRLAWFENLGTAQGWRRHDVSRRVRGMFDKFVARDVDHDGDLDLFGTRGNSYPYDGVFWLEQVRSASPLRSFSPARANESPEVPLPSP